MLHIHDLTYSWKQTNEAGTIFIFIVLIKALRLRETWPACTAGMSAEQGWDTHSYLKNTWSSMSLSRTTVMYCSCKSTWTPNHMPLIFFVQWPQTGKGKDRSPCLGKGSLQGTRGLQLNLIPRKVPTPEQKHGNSSLPAASLPKKETKERQLKYDLHGW